MPISGSRKARAHDMDHTIISRDGNALVADLEKLATPIRTIGTTQGLSGLMERFQLSTQTLTKLATYEATKPGRKLLVWLRPGRPLLSGSSFHYEHEEAEEVLRFFC